MSRTSLVHAITLREQGRRNAALLESIQSNLPRYLNPIYLSVMMTQNGSASLIVRRSLLLSGLRIGEHTAW